MSKYYICDLDKNVNGQQIIDVETALSKVEQFILKTIDPTFPIDQFREWTRSDSEKPFRWNHNRYYWS